ncbi:MAG: antitoxin Xre/MbcA/ParS toxin-binding domain-containing protein [Pseudomonadota bacterium]
MHDHNAASIAQLARRILGDQKKAREWLDKPNLQLGGRTPREALTTKEGIRRVEELLTQIDDDQRLHRG